MSRFAFLIAFMVFVFAGSTAFALSDYGHSCSNNDDCLECKENEECLICMNACYNFYGSAESKVEEQLNADDRCKKKQAKWCNAQCWDPDDTAVENYITTKPQCRTAF